MEFNATVCVTDRIQLSKGRCNSVCLWLNNPMATKTALVTGANKGMGYQTALALARRNFKVIMVDKEDQIQSRNKIVRESCNENVYAQHLDLASFASVRCLAEELKETEKYLTVLINNAGVFCMKHKKTSSGLDAVIQINHFGPFLLTHLLAELLGKSKGGRIIFVTSIGAFLHNLNLQTLKEPKIFSPDIVATAVNYYNSKLCNMISSKGFAEKLKKEKVTCNCLHPGITNTDFMLNTLPGDGFIGKIAKKITKSVLTYTARDAEQAVGLCTYLATSDMVKDVTGKFFVDYRIHREPAALEESDFCGSIWKETEVLTGIHRERGRQKCKLDKDKLLLE